MNDPSAPVAVSLAFEADKEGDGATEVDELGDEVGKTVEVVTAAEVDAMEVDACVVDAPVQPSGFQVDSALQ